MCFVLVAIKGQCRMWTVEGEHLSPLNSVMTTSCRQVKTPLRTTSLQMNFPETVFESLCRDYLLDMPHLSGGEILLAIEKWSEQRFEQIYAQNLERNKYFVCLKKKKVKSFQFNLLQIGAKTKVFYSIKQLWSASCQWHLLNAAWFNTIRRRLFLFH